MRRFTRKPSGFASRWTLRRGDDLPSLVRHIREDFSIADVPHCRDAGCELGLTGLSEYVILKGETLRSDRAICDCLVFAMMGELVVGIVELKTGAVHATSINRKLTNGLELAQEILEGYSFQLPEAQFRPVLLHKGIDPSEYVVITSRPISFRGLKCWVRVKHCGSQLATIA